MTAEQKGDILNELEGDDTVDGGKEFVSAHHLPARPLYIVYMVVFCCEKAQYMLVIYLKNIVVCRKIGNGLYMFIVKTTEMLRMQYVYFFPFLWYNINVSDYLI